ncbi:MAG: CCA tRNA nucleotidyltransferase, partial [uncultured Thermomicrobiales bacterium]
SDSQRRAIARLVTAFAREGRALYLVGGAVRDLLLGQTPPDLDFATAAPPDRIREAASATGADAIYSANERFATVALRLEAEAVEVTTFRGPASPGTPDDKGTASDLFADLALRDFTINAMAVALDMNTLAGAIVPIIDPFGGRDDLDRRTIRGVEDPGARLAEDPLRALRAVRFATELDATIEGETRAAIVATAPALGGVSPERIGAELGRILLMPGVADGLQLLERLGLLARVLPEIMPLVEFAAERSKDLWAHTRLVVARTPARLAVRWAALLHDVAKPRTYATQGAEVHFFGHETIGARIARKALARLKLERELVEGVGAIVELHGRPAAYGADWTDGAVRRLMLDIGPWLGDLLDLARADVTSGRPQVQRAARERIDRLAAHCERLAAERELAKLQSPLDGTQLMALFDRPPGKWIKPLKDHLRDLVIDGILAPEDEAGATDEAKRWMAENGG